jgi:hypothetical protein
MNVDLFVNVVSAASQIVGIFCAPSSRFDSHDPSDGVRRVVVKKLRIFIFATVHDWTKHQAIQVRLMKYGSYE